MPRETEAAYRAGNAPPRFLPHPGAGPRPSESGERPEREGCAGQPTLKERFAALEAQGRKVVGLQVSSPDEWNVTHRWASEHPGHPDRPEGLEHVRERA